MVPETTGIGINLLRNVSWTNTVSFINFGQQKVHQDSLCPRSLTLESWRMDGSWDPWNWYKFAKKCILNQYCKFHQLWIAKSPSRLPMSSKSDPGVLEDRMVPETIKIVFNVLRNVFWIGPESLSPFRHTEHCQDSLCPLSLTLESWRTLHYSISGLQKMGRSSETKQFQKFFTL